ncbi:DNA polymerase III subunit alpha [Candidatus Shikimatogenerans bostrichidophilus]|uniref:DNA polymerase III subunit alpha n=1 Tax=Candidatus Shikimatogenerans bostrichidophilus TaxID=2943807 RepID=UPI0029676F09
MNFAGSSPALGIYVFFFDVETTGLPKDNKFILEKILQWPRLIQISWQLYNYKYKLIDIKNYYIKNLKKNKYFKKNNIIYGKIKTIKEVLNKFYKLLKNTYFIIGHNINFDCNIIIGEYYRLNKNLKIKNILFKKNKINTIKLINYNKYLNLKNTFNLLYNRKKKKFLFHNSLYDIYINIFVFIKLIYYKLIKFNFKFNIKKFLLNIPIYNNIKLNKKINYFNIHNHSDYSIFNSTIKIKDLIKKSIKYKMKSVGITDNNMMGVYKFYEEINKINKVKKIIKGIVGCEINIKIKNKLYPYILIIKNIKGYYNLIKINSYSNIKTKNINYINIKIIKKYSKGLIFLTGTLKSEISYYIIKNKIKKAIKILLDWKKIFKNNIFIEIFRDGFKYEKKVNKYLIFFSKKYKIKYINQQETFYLNKSDYKIYKILLCIKNKINIYQNNDKNIFPKNNFYLKKYSNIKNKFKKFKKGFKNLNILFKKIKYIKLNNRVLLPKYKINKKFNNKNYLYLKYLIYKGAKKKYGKINNKINKRIIKELKIIKYKNFENYFLIVYDLIKKAKELDIYVGPGRGSVAGSIIAYCLNITKVDPLKFNLIFERFLNNERIKLPDIDIDLEDKGRKKLLLYINYKYGGNVANIITYNKIGSKTAIKDVSRVFNLSFKEANNLSKMIINNFTLKKILNNNILFFKKKLSLSKFNKILNIRNIYNDKNSIKSKILKYAKKLEGLIRCTGIHACGIIITSNKLINYVPLMYNNKNNNLLLTQYDKRCIENIGLLKIDLLALKTLNIIKNSLLEIIKNKKKIKLNLYDNNTYKLFNDSKTTGIFQFDSYNIKQILNIMKPNNFKDLIAINALYRPGTINNLYEFLLRKKQIKQIKYDIKDIKKYLIETYGITLYQEQVILIARKLSGISKSDADILREAIGKKQINKLNLIKKKFLKKALKKGYLLNQLKKIWKGWENFVLYAFNKAHATCYSFIAYQTGFLKINYTIEFMCTLLNNNINNKKQIERFINDAKKFKIKILPPDINISKYKFVIEKNKYIRSGLGIIKNIGYKTVNEIIKQKKFKSLKDFLIKIKIKNKKVIKSLILSGAFDCFKIKRYIYFLKYNKKFNIINYLLFKINNKINDKLLNKIFNIKKKINKKYIKLYYINKQKKILGYYIKLHPLYYYKFEIIYLKLKNLNYLKYKNYKIYYFYGLIKKIYYYNNNYYILIEDNLNNNKKILINNNLYNKNIIKLYNIIIIKCYFIYNNINILNIIDINDIFNYYNLMLLKINKNIFINHNKIIKKFLYFKKKYKGKQKIYIQIYYLKNIYKKIIIKNIKINRNIFIFLNENNKHKNIKYSLF